MKNNLKKKISLRSRITHFFIIVCSIFYIVIGATLLFFYNTVLFYITDNYTKSIDKQIRLIDNELDNARKLYNTVLFNNADLANLALTDDPFSVAISKSRLSQYLLPQLSNVKGLDGLFFYANKTDSFVSASLDSSSGEHIYFKNLLRSEEFSDKTTIIYKKWIIITIGNSYFLVRMTSYNGCIAGAWADISSLFISFNNTMPADSLYYFIDNSDNTIFSASNLDSFSYNPSNNNKLISLNNSREKYLQIVTELPFFDGSLISLIPIKDIQTSMAYYYYFLLITLLINIVILIFLSTIIRRYMSIPLIELHRISENLKEGEDNYLKYLQYDSIYKEVSEVQTEAIKLSQKLFELKDVLLNEQLMKQRFELKSLRNQVSPHFFINCLSNLSSMVSTGVNQDLMKRTIAALTGHLRYMLSEKQFVSLSEELRYVENYFELTNLRCPGGLKYSIKVHGLCDNASIFPSLILMLSENSIKHNLVMGEILSITISAWEETGAKNERFIHIVHYDTGRGYPEEVLEKINSNSFNLSEISSDDGIGIYNIINRIHLIYGKKSGTISFTNRENSGAEINIQIPYIPYQESGS